MLSIEMTPTTVEIPRPEIKPIEVTDEYGKFTVEPLDRGYGMTLGNPLRRLLLSSIQGTAVTWVKIEGVMHEYSTIPHVKEGVTELLVNFKSSTPLPQKSMKFDDTKKQGARLLVSQKQTIQLPLRMRMLWRRVEHE